MVVSSRNAPGGPRGREPQRVSHEVMQDLTTDTRRPGALPDSHVVPAVPRARRGRGRSAVARAAVVAVARHGAGVELTPEAEAAVRRPAGRSSRRWPTTRCRTTACPPASGRWPTGTSRARLRAELQRSLVRSHAAGSGPEVEREVVRAMQLLRLSTLATGRTGRAAGHRPRLRGAADRRDHPVVAEYGSLGCSGDLAPLAPCALALTGEGMVRDADGRAAARPPRRWPRRGSSR